MKKILIILFIGCLFSACYLKRIYSPPLIPDYFKRIVAFAEVPYKHSKTGKINRNKGTGFFVGVKKDEKHQTLAFVTAKHLFDPPQDHELLDQIYFHVHDKNGNITDIPPLPLIKQGKDKNIFFHENHNVDLAVISAVPSPAIFNYNYVPDALIAKKDDFKQETIAVGTEILFLGRFQPHVGIKQNQPITRFGRVALICDEKIEWDGKKLELFLIECTSFGGNSGSPVFAYFGAKKKPYTLKTYEPDFKLVGVLKGSFNEGSQMGIRGFGGKLKLDIKVSQNMGITAVIPSYLLLDILFCEDLKKQRKEEPKGVTSALDIGYIE